MSASEPLLIVVESQLLVSEQASASLDAEQARRVSEVGEAAVEATPEKKAVQAEVEATVEKVEETSTAAPAEAEPAPAAPTPAAPAPAAPAPAAVAAAAPAAETPKAKKKKNCSIM